MSGSPRGSDRLDGLFIALAAEDRRCVIRYFRSSGDAVASVDDLVEFVLEQDATTADRERVALALRHAALPKLADAGIIDYDGRSQTVRYREHPVLERIVNLTAELEAGIE